MPNGYHNNPAIDLIVHRHTEHGEPCFRTHCGDGGVVSVHMEHIRGYAYMPRWEAESLSLLLYGRVRHTSRATMDAMAASLVAKVVALMASNPTQNVKASRASALLVVDGFAIVMGDYHLYTRSQGHIFEHIEPPIGRRDPALLGYIEAKPEMTYLAQDTGIAATRGLPWHEPGDCVSDIRTADEWIASTAPLHEYPSWSDLARLPLDTIESNGHLLTAVRDSAVKQGTDHIAIRARRASR